MLFLHYPVVFTFGTSDHARVYMFILFQVSSSSFLLAAQTRWRRGNTRKQALVHMRELLTAAVRVGGVTHLVGPVTMVLQGGPRFEFIITLFEKCMFIFC